MCDSYNRGRLARARGLTTDRLAAARSTAVLRSRFAMSCVCTAGFSSAATSIDLASAIAQNEQRGRHGRRGCFFEAVISATPTARHLTTACDRPRGGREPAERRKQVPHAQAVSALLLAKRGEDQAPRRRRTRPKQKVQPPRHRSLHRSQQPPKPDRAAIAQTRPTTHPAQSKEAVSGHPLTVCDADVGRGATAAELDLLRQAGERPARAGRPTGLPAVPKQTSEPIRARGTGTRRSSRRDHAAVDRSGDRPGVGPACTGAASSISRATVLSARDAPLRPPSAQRLGAPPAARLESPHRSRSTVRMSRIRVVPLPARPPRARCADPHGVPRRTHPDITAGG